MDATLIVTMAGAGQRFLDVGFAVPKYRLEVHGRSLFAWSQESLRKWAEAGCRFIFVARTSDQLGDYLAEQCQQLSISNFQLLELDALTDGQATTALAAGALILDPDKPVAVYNIDTFVRPDDMSPSEVRGDGWIPCFPGEGSQWSFARVDETDRVLELREKVRISPHATVGFYWFSSFALYERAYHAYYQATGREEAGERYIAPLYNQLLSWSLPCYIHRVPTSAVTCLGTPAELEAFAVQNR